MLLAFTVVVLNLLNWQFAFSEASVYPSSVRSEYFKYLHSVSRPKIE